MSGTNDMCTPLIAKLMYDAIPHTQWELFDGARHMCRRLSAVTLGACLREARALSFQS